MKGNISKILSFSLFLIILLSITGGSFAQTYSIQSESSEFGIEILEKEHNVDVDDVVRIGYQVRNSGEEGTETLELMIDDEVLEENELTLEKGETYVNGFRWRANEEGIFTIRIVCGEIEEEAGIFVSAEDSRWVTIDDFEGEADGSAPEDWDILEDESFIDFEIDDSESFYENNSLFFKGSRWHERAEGRNQFPSIQPDELKLYYRRNPETEWRKDNRDSHNLRWQDEEGSTILSMNVYAHGYSNDRISWEPTGALVEEDNGDYDENATIAGETEVWYEVRWHNINWEQGTYDINITDTRDEEEIATWENLDFKENESEMSQIYIDASGWTAEGGRLDNISLAPQEEHFNLEIIDYDNETVIGEPINLEYRVKNTGNVEGKQNITLESEENYKDSIEVNLEKEESYKGEFILSTEDYEPGEYNLTVKSEDEKVTVPVSLIQPGFFEVEMINPEESDEYKVGETVNISYQIKNTGGSVDIQDIIFEVEDQMITKEEMVEIGKNDTHQGSFTWQTSSTGIFNLTVSTEDDKENVSIEIVGESHFKTNIDSVMIFIIWTPWNPGFDLLINLRYQVENTGDIEDTKLINFTVEDERKGDVIYEDSNEVTIEENQSKEDNFVWTTNIRENAGWFNLDISSEDNSDQVKVHLPTGMVRF